MENWLEYIDTKLSGYEVFNEYKNQDSFYPIRCYKINGTYLSFEFEGSERIRKVECGKYFFKEEVNYVSVIKAVLDKTKKDFVDFLQLSFDGENDEKYELSFDSKNRAILNEFLKLPIEQGWTEKRYKYKDGAYKVKIMHHENQESEIMLLTPAEQDMPLIGERFSRKIDTFIIDNFYGKRNISVEVTEVHPFNSSIDTKSKAIC